MIAHLAPRRVAVVSTVDGRRHSCPVDLDSILAADLFEGSSDRVALGLRLTRGRQIVAGSYADVAEAGRDCGYLRLLAGLPALSAGECREAGSGSRRRRWSALFVALTAVGLWRPGRLVTCTG